MTMLVKIVKILSEILDYNETTPRLSETTPTKPSKLGYARVETQLCH